MQQQDNLDLCRVSKGTPMGTLIRHYWIPAGLSSDLPHPDCDPIRVRLVGENFVAFRDDQGRVGMLDEHCAHRRASLVLGRVEKGGIECLYHGWRFDIEGRILEMPNCDDESYKTRYRAKAYPVREAGGVIWVYLGEAEEAPEFPIYPWMTVPAEYRYVRALMHPANFVQAMEAVLDSSHLSVLHQDSLPGRRPDNAQHFGRNASFKSMAQVRTPKIEVEETPFGLYYAALRPLEDDGRSFVDARVTCFTVPFTVNVPYDEGRSAMMFVPWDDGTTCMFNIQWNEQRPIGQEQYRNEIDAAGGTPFELIQRFGFHRDTYGKPGTASWENNWLQDREKMQQGSYSGLPQFYAEDVAVTSSPGRISDRQELLVPADLAVVRMRRVMLAAARNAASGGVVPHYAPGQGPEDVTPIARRLRPEDNWRSLVDTRKLTREPVSA